MGFSTRMRHICHVPILWIGARPFDLRRRQHNWKHARRNYAPSLQKRHAQLFSSETTQKGRYNNAVKSLLIKIRHKERTR